MPKHLDSLYYDILNNPDSIYTIFKNRKYANLIKR